MHGRVAQQLMDLVYQARQKDVDLSRRPAPMVRPKGDLANLVTAAYSDLRSSSMVLSDELGLRLKRIVLSLANIQFDLLPSRYLPLPTRRRSKKLSNFDRLLTSVITRYKCFQLSEHLIINVSSSALFNLLKSIPQLNRCTATTAINHVHHLQNRFWKLLSN